MKLAVSLALVLTAVGIAYMAPDLMRYLKIRAM